MNIKIGDVFRLKYGPKSYIQIVPKREPLHKFYSDYVFKYLNTLTYDAAGLRYFTQNCIKATKLESLLYGQ